MKKNFLPLMFALLAFNLPAQTYTDYPIEMTLEDCLDYAISRNYNRESVVLDEESRQASYDQSKLERLPSLSASLSENVSHTNHNDALWNGSYGLDASMVLYQGGSIRNTIEQNRLYRDQATFQIVRYDNELSIQILQTFLSIIGNEELLKYQVSVLRASEEQLKQGEAQFAAGMILESDYLLLQAQYASDENNIRVTRATIDNDLLTLKSLMSMDLAEPIRILSPDTTYISRMAQLPSREYATQRALETLPEIDIVTTSVLIAETNLKIARSSFLPTVSLGGSISSGHNQNFKDYSSQLSDRFNQQAGINVSIPIFNRGRTRTNVIQSDIALRQAELDKMQTEIDITRTVLQEYTDVETAYSRYVANSIKENAYARSFEAYGAQFNAGSITTVDLLQQQNNYINSLQEYIQSKYSFILRRKILDIYMGERITM